MFTALTRQRDKNIFYEFRSKIQFYKTKIKDSD